MKNLIIVLALLVSTTTFAEDKEKQKQCTTYCNSANMDGTGGQICQTVCS